MPGMFTYGQACDITAQRQKQATFTRRRELDWSDEGLGALIGIFGWTSTVKLQIGRLLKLRRRFKISVIPSGSLPVVHAVDLAHILDSHPRIWFLFLSRWVGLCAHLIIGFYEDSGVCTHLFKGPTSHKGYSFPCLFLKLFDSGINFILHIHALKCLSGLAVG